MKLTACLTWPDLWPDFYHSSLLHTIEIHRSDRLLGWPDLYHSTRSYRWNTYWGQTWPDLYTSSVFHTGKIQRSDGLLGCPCAVMTVRSTSSSIIDIGNKYNVYMIIIVLRSCNGNMDGCKLVWIYPSGGAIINFVTAIVWVCADHPRAPRVVAADHVSTRPSESLPLLWHTPLRNISQ